MVTIRDVARRAGVAPITVSRVLNNSGYFSQEIKARVETAAAELNYVPNLLARSLRSHRTHTLALVLSDVTNPFWTTVARGVEDAASREGFTVFLCNSDENERKQAEYLAVLLRKRVDGILLVPARSTPEPVRTIQRQGIQVVVMDRSVPGAQVDVVRGSSLQGAQLLMCHLLELGHRRIAVLSGPEQVSTARERVEGARQALIEAGLSPTTLAVLHHGYTVESGYQMARQALVLTPRPTAFFAANNFIAIGALQALREFNLRVPGDLSLVAFDDLPISWMAEPFLTVAAQPAYEMGRRATELLLQRIADPTAPWQEVVLPMELLIRQSCRAIQPEVAIERGAGG
ncbi:MAG: LacI family transcriptional regulator [Chloroflexi bacterium]|nr:MAG: LacI family transcriptional regulator [Chloroflexota bacterium]